MSNIISLRIELTAEPRIGFITSERMLIAAAVVIPIGFPAPADRFIVVSFGTVADHLAAFHQGDTVVVNSQRVELSQNQEDEYWNFMGDFILSQFDEAWDGEDVPIYQIISFKVEVEKINTPQKEYRCTRNALYTHQCLGHDDLTARQGHYIKASSQEEAWEKMAIRFPDEVEQGFTVQDWEGFNVQVVEVKRDEK